MAAQVSGLAFKHWRIVLGERRTARKAVARGAPVGRDAEDKIGGIGAALKQRSADATDATAWPGGGKLPPHFRPRAGKALVVMSHYAVAVLLPQQPLRGGVVELEIKPSRTLALQKPANSRDWQLRPQPARRDRAGHERTASGLRLRVFMLRKKSLRASRSI